MLDLVAYCWQALDLSLVMEKADPRVEPAIEVLNVPSQELGIFFVPVLLFAEDAAGIAGRHCCVFLIRSSWSRGISQGWSCFTGLSVVKSLKMSRDSGGI